MCSAPDIDTPVQRQQMKQPERKAPRSDDPRFRRRGYASLIARAPSLQPASTTATMGG